MIYANLKRCEYSYSDFFVIRKYAIQMVTAKTTPAYFIGSFLIGPVM